MPRSSGCAIAVLVLGSLAIARPAIQAQSGFGIFLASYEKGAGLRPVVDSNKQTYFIRTTPDFTERDLVSAMFAIHDYLSAIKVTFSPQAAQRFRAFTRANRKRPLVFMLGNTVLMVPFVEGESTDAFVWITTSPAYSEATVRGWAASIAGAIPKQH
jgi:preprotein translocase subunit SecD